MMTNDPAGAAPAADLNAAQPAAQHVAATEAGASTTGRTLRHVDVMAAARIGAIMLMVIGVAYIAWILLILLISARPLLLIYGYYGAGDLLGNGFQYSILYIGGWLIGWAITGFLFGAFYAWIYNLGLKWIGGLHVDVNVAANGSGSSSPNSEISTGTKRTIRRADPMSLAKFGVLDGFVLGVMLMIILLFIVLFDRRPLLSVYAMYGSGDLLGNSFLSTIAAIVGGIAAQMIAGFIILLLFAWLFNISTRWTGGLPITVAPSSSDPSAQGANTTSGITANGGSGTVTGTTRRTIRHVNVMSYAKLTALLFMLISVFFNLILLLILVLGVQSVLPNFGFYDGGDLLGKDWLSRIVSIVGSGITWAVLGAIEGALFAWLFNATIKWTGGLQFDVS